MKKMHIEDKPKAQVASCSVFGVVRGVRGWGRKSKHGVVLGSFLCLHSPDGGTPVVPTTRETLRCFSFICVLAPVALCLGRFFSPSQHSPLSVCSKPDSVRRLSGSERTPRRGCRRH